MTRSSRSAIADFLGRDMDGNVLILLRMFIHRLIFLTPTPAKQGTKFPTQVTGRWTDSIAKRVTH